MREWRLIRLPWSVLMAAALVLAGCAGQPRAYDCSTWSQSDGSDYNRAKRDACFPDCPSCGPVLRERNPYADHQP
jgi:hypothetical protein